MEYIIIYFRSWFKKWDFTWTWTTKINLLVLVKNVIIPKILPESKLITYCLKSLSYGRKKTYLILSASQLNAYSTGCLFKFLFFILILLVKSKVQKVGTFDSRLKGSQGRELSLPCEPFNWQTPFWINCNTYFYFKKQRTTAEFLARSSQQAIDILGLYLGSVTRKIIYKFKSIC